MRNNVWLQFKSMVHGTIEVTIFRGTSPPPWLCDSGHLTVSKITSQKLTDFNYIFLKKPFCFRLRCWGNITGHWLNLFTTFLLKGVKFKMRLISLARMVTIVLEAEVTWKSAPETLASMSDDPSLLSSDRTAFYPLDVSRWFCQNSRLNKQTNSRRLTTFWGVIRRSKICYHYLM